MIFYCALMVHITDTRTQNVVSYSSAHITETVLAHDQHWEEQSSYIYHTKAILVRHKLRNNSQTTTAFFLHTGVLNN